VSRTDRRFPIVLLAIVALAAFLRLYELRSLPPGLYADEAMDGNNALEALETHRFQPFYPEDNGREGLYVNVAALSIACFGHQAWALRLPAAVFGVLSVVGVALLGAELFGEPVGLLAAFFLATSFWHVLLSREAFRSIAAPCFLAWSVWLLLAGARRPRWLALAGAVYGLGFYTYLAYRATPLLLALLLRRVGWRRAALFVAVAAVVAAPLAVYFAAHPGAFFGRAEQVSVWRSPHPAVETALNLWRTARMFFTRGDYNWRHNLPWRAELFWPVAMFFVIGAMAPRKGKWVPLAWLAIAALPVALSDENMPHAQRSVLMLPPAVLLAALGAVRAYEVVRARLPRRVAVGCAAALVAWLACEPYYTYFRRWARDPAMPRFFDAAAAEVARQIDALPREEEKYVVTPPGDPMAPQPVMFLTGSYTALEQVAAHIHYLEEADCGRAAERLRGASVFCLPRRAP